MIPADAQRSIYTTTIDVTPQASEIDALAAALQSGDRLSLSRAITIFESTRLEHKFLATALLRKLQNDHTKTAFRIGISGPPGAGKSTLIEALGCAMVDANDRVAVLAIDPSSKRSGGAILGDKTRMPRLSASDSAYVRPTPARGTLGGVSRFTSDAVIACSAAGYNKVLVETVGVGQSETAVDDLVDCFILVVPPVGGDELQGIKRGITELADIIVVNKADGGLESTAARAAASFRGTMHFQRAHRHSWTPTVLTCSAQTGFGVEDLRQQIEDFKFALSYSGELYALRREQRKKLVWTATEETVLEDLRTNANAMFLLKELLPDILSGKMAPRSAAELIAGYYAEYD